MPIVSRFGMTLRKAIAVEIRRGLLQTTGTPFAGTEKTSEGTVTFLGNLTVLFLVPTLVLVKSVYSLLLTSCYSVSSMLVHVGSDQLFAIGKNVMGRK